MKFKVQYGLDYKPLILYLEAARSSAAGQHVGLILTQKAKITMQKLALGYGLMRLEPVPYPQIIT